MRTKELGTRALLAGLLVLAASRCHDGSNDADRGVVGGGVVGAGRGGMLPAEDIAQRTAALSTRPTTAPPGRTAATAVVGSVPGTGWVGHDGAYHYRIPIEVPPGRGGMAPSVSIGYSSQGGNGPLGVGFSLEGSSSISRCEKMMAAGGTRDRIQFSTRVLPAFDVYCLDGQRMVLVSGTNGDVGAEYRTEMDNFTRVKIATKSDTETITKWTAETKDGRFLTYEVLADTVATDIPQPWTQRQLVNADSAPNGAATTVQLVWPLTKQYDRSGNGMRYSYVRSSGPTWDNAGDVPLLSQIDYTTCETTPCDFPDSARPRRITLSYEARPAEDKLERWVNGVVVRTNVRLRSIGTLVQADGGQWLPQRFYNLEYWFDYADANNHRVTKRSLLKSLSMCEGIPVGGPNPACVATTFDWQSRAEHKLRAAPTETPTNPYSAFVGNSARMELVVFDANGDGNDDILLHEPNQQASTTNGAFPANTTYKERVLIADGGGQFKSAVDVNWNAGACKSLTHTGMSLPVDLDGNGTTELVVECRNYGVLAWDPSANTLVEVNVPGITDLLQPGATTTSPNRGAEGFIKLADLNGDGLPELLTTVVDTSTPPIRRWAQQIAQSATPSSGLAPHVSYLTKESTGVRAVGPSISNGVELIPQVTTVLDLDGDGHQELVQIDYKSTMRGYQIPPLFPDDHSYRFHDIINNVKWLWNTEVRGEPQSGTHNWGVASFSDGTAGQSLWYFADVNGDGLKDALYLTAASPSPTWTMRINTGEGFLAPTPLDTSRCRPEWVGPKGSNSNLLIADLNGDGRDDLIKLSGARNLATPNWSGYAGTRDPIRVCYSNGAGFDAPINLPLAQNAYRLFDDKDEFVIPPPLGGSGSYPAERFTMTQVGDFNGDGIADLVDFVAGTTGGLVQGKRKPDVTLLDPAAIRGGVDLLTKVSDGRGARQVVTYDSMSSGTRARLGTTNIPAGLRDTHVPSAGSYPTASMQKGAVVRRFEDDAQATPGRWSYTFHLYEGARASVTGRGFLGFNRHLTIDQITGDVTDYKFSMSSFSGEAQYYQYPLAMRPTSMQARAAFTATTEIPSVDTSTLVAATGVVNAPGMDLSELYEGHPLRLEHVYQTDYQRTRDAGGTGPVTATSSLTFKELAYDDWGNLTSASTETTEDVDPAFVPHYKRTVTSTFDNIINATTWRLGELRRMVETTSSTDPYVTGASVSDTRATEYWFDTKGRLDTVVREPNTSTSTPQGTNGELTMTQFFHNNAGQVTGVRRFSPTGLACTSDSNCAAGQLCTNAARGAPGQCWSSRTDSFGYDVSGTFVEKFTNALGQIRWELYDSSSLLSYLSADENGVKTVLTRDGFGRVVQAKNDARGTTSITYARESNGPYDIVRTSDATGARGSTFIDRFGNKHLQSWSTFDGGSGVADFRFDNLGHVTATRYKSSSSSEATVSATTQSITDAIASGTTISLAGYDRANRLVSSSVGTTDTTKFSYPAFGKTTIVDDEDLSSMTVSDSAGRIVTRTQGANSITYRYKGDGALASITGAGNHIERFYFDKLGRKTLWTTGIGGSASDRLRATSYDSFDRMTAYTLNGVAITLGYDALDRIVSRASGSEAQTYEWDVGSGSVGRLTRAFNNDGSHEIANTFDTRGHLSGRRETFVDAGGTTSLSFGYEYDGAGRVNKMRYPEAAGSGDVSAVTHSSKGGPSVQYNYQNGQLASITEITTGVTGSPILWRADSRHPLGMLTAATYGAPADANRLTATWGYNNGTLHLESHNVAGTTSGPTPAQSFTYFGNDKLKTRTTSGLKEGYTYAGPLGFLETYHRDDGAGQKLVDAKFSYDDTGMTGVDTTGSTGSPDWGTDDETMVPLTPNLTYQIDQQQVGSNPRRRYLYDGIGRISRVNEQSGTCSTSSPCAAGSTCALGTCVRTRRTIAWNSFNLPTQITDSIPSSVTRTFRYDAFGNRVRKTQDANNEVLYLGKLYEQRNLTALGARESVYRLYTEVGVVAELVHPWGSTTNRTTRYLFSDHQGSIAYSVVNRASTQLGFFPYGKRMGTPPAQNFSQLGYTGHYQDDDLNLINMSGRIYDVSMRRFLSPDIIADGQLQVFGTNAYAYVRHDPVNWVDPTGFQTGGYEGMTNNPNCMPAGGICPELPDPEPPPPTTTTPPATPPTPTQTQTTPTPSTPPPTAAPSPTPVAPAQPAQPPQPPPAMNPADQASAAASDAHLREIGDPRSGFTPAGRIPLGDRFDPGSANLEKVNKYGMPPRRGDRVFQLESETLDAFLLLRAMAAVAGFDEELFTLTSAYRSQTQQDGLKGQADQAYGAKQSGTYVAKLSEHITGRTFDLSLGPPNNVVNIEAGDFMGLDTFEWLRTNAPDFGLNPYDAEPWHWSYNVE